MVLALKNPLTAEGSHEDPLSSATLDVKLGVENILNWGISSGIASGIFNGVLYGLDGVIPGAFLGTGLGAAVGLMQNTYRSIRKIIK